MEYGRWLDLMNKLGIDNNKEVFDNLLAAYSEKHRYYHNTQHIDAVLKHLDETKNLAENPIELEIALWFHDAVYKPFSSSNELDSADWAARFLQKNGRNQKLIDNVHALIMATLHTHNSTAEDDQLIVDIDLTILGASDQVYDVFEENVRKEYKWVPWLIYRKKRKAILEGFLNRERIYNTDFFYKKLEQQARENMQRTILTL